MRIHILSDLHLEFTELENRTVDCDVIVLAGDISVVLVSAMFIHARSIANISMLQRKRHDIGQVSDNA